MIGILQGEWRNAASTGMPATGIGTLLDRMDLEFEMTDTVPLPLNLNVHW